MTITKRIFFGVLLTLQLTCIHAERSVSFTCWDNTKDTLVLNLTESGLDSLIDFYMNDSIEIIELYFDSSLIPCDLFQLNCKEYFIATLLDSYHFNELKVNSDVENMYFEGPNLTALKADSNYFTNLMSLDINTKSKDKICVEGFGSCLFLTIQSESNSLEISGFAIKRQFLNISFVGNIEYISFGKRKQNIDSVEIFILNQDSLKRLIVKGVDTKQFYLNVRNLDNCRSLKQLLKLGNESTIVNYEALNSNLCFNMNRQTEVTVDSGKDSFGVYNIYRKVNN